MSKNRNNQEMVEEVLPTGTTSRNNPYDYGKVKAKKTEKKLYTQAEMGEAVKAENKACALFIENFITYGTDSYLEGMFEICAEGIEARIK